MEGGKDEDIEGFWWREEALGQGGREGGGRRTGVDRWSERDGGNDLRGKLLAGRPAGHWQGSGPVWCGQQQQVQGSHTGALTDIHISLGQCRQTSLHRARAWARINLNKRRMGPALGWPTLTVTWVSWAQLGLLALLLPASCLSCWNNHLNCNLNHPTVYRAAFIWQISRYEGTGKIKVN